MLSDEVAAKNPLEVAANQSGAVVTLATPPSSRILAEPAHDQRPPSAPTSFEAFPLKLFT
jgi:hypothetical protein